VLQPQTALPQGGGIQLPDGSLAVKFQPRENFDPKTHLLRIDLLLRDWTPQGNLHWLRESVRLRMGEEKTK